MTKDAMAPDASAAEDETDPTSARPAIGAMPRLAGLARRVAADAGCGGRDPWDIHVRALARTAAGDDVILLSIGQEVEERTPETVLAAANASLATGRHHYGDVRGTPSLRRTIADHHTALTGQSVEADQVVVTAGAQNALFALAQVLLEPGDEVVMVDPYYTTYPGTFGASGARIVTVPLDDDLHLAPRALARAMSARTRVLVLNTPNNPVGECYDQSVWDTAIDLCRSHGAWLLADLVYLEIVDREALALPHCLPEAADCLISIGSLSKSHRMTGWRVGWTVSPATVATALGDLSLCMHYGLPPFVQDAAQAALLAASDTPRRVQRALADRRRVVHRMLATPTPLTLHDSGHGMFMLLDTRRSGLDGYTFAKSLLEQEAVALLPCDGFGERGRYLVRLGLCTNSERLGEACRRLLRFIARLG